MEKLDGWNLMLFDIFLHGNIQWKQIHETVANERDHFAGETLICILYR